MGAQGHEEEELLQLLGIHSEDELPPFSIGFAASSSSCAWALPPELYCPITREPMRDPVLAADSHTYERDAIEAWIARQQAAGQQATSPLTNLPLAHTELAPNRVVRSLTATLAGAWDACAG
ncbi:hypothetical protein CHLNCDRAFT_138721 [Chlorella variabilis]|uniref:U-box domain-containing protein n=1 Tax=Chlorella variabilis TaxID=554065 RepID=E1ZNM3_CHLVA|nr:hypothetical protein CHLNCDRAFT_138721 [Chlorella variabilis]EFN52631.1 hypothetical protein CHLNCDRAFT_138721 [Chlorella variabilis]|eukprot:XP_005844733.1 hypothetical protein CHLNCDRAFT_138721 [Chlorella variabilis]